MFCTIFFDIFNINPENFQVSVQVPSFLGLWTYGHDFCLLDLQAYGILIDLKHGNLVLTLRVWDALDLGELSI
ncbi:unnamed protein product [Rhizophagus irregularis]|nr:unnamed protein product [Rhizophagus irregularis]